MRNELLQIKINSLYETQLEEAFMTRTPYLTSKEVTSFLVQPKE